MELKSLLVRSCGAILFFLSAYQLSSEIELSVRGSVTNARVAGFTTPLGDMRSKKLVLDLETPGATLTCVPISLAWTRNPTIGLQVRAIYQLHDGLTCEVDTFLDRWLGSLFMLALSLIFMFSPLRENRY